MGEITEIDFSILFKEVFSSQLLPPRIKLCRDFIRSSEIGLSSLKGNIPSCECALSKLYHICGGPNDKAEDQLFWMTGEFLEKAKHATISSTDYKHTALLSRFNFILEKYARFCFKRKDESAIARMTNLIEKSGQKRVNVLLVVTVNVLFKLTKYHEITESAQKNSISNLVSIDGDTLTSNVLEFYYQLGISFFIQALYTQAHEYLCYASCMMKRDTPFEFEKRLLLSASINAFLWQTDQFYANDEIFAKHFESFRFQSDMYFVKLS